jgi:hypothetical protein
MCKLFLLIKTHFSDGKKCLVAPQWDFTFIRILFSEIPLGIRVPVSTWGKGVILKLMGWVGR